MAFDLTSLKGTYQFAVHGDQEVPPNKIKFQGTGLFTADGKGNMNSTGSNNWLDQHFFFGGTTPYTVSPTGIGEIRFIIEGTPAGLIMAFKTIVTEPPSGGNRIAQIGFSLTNTPPNILSASGSASLVGFVHPCHDLRLLVDGLTGELEDLHKQLHSAGPNEKPDILAQIKETIAERNEAKKKLHLCEATYPPGG